jgi:hypothetical protein
MYDGEIRKKRKGLGDAIHFRGRVLTHDSDEFTVIAAAFSVERSENGLVIRW